MGEMGEMREMGTVGVWSPNPISYVGEDREDGKTKDIRHKT